VKRLLLVAFAALALTLGLSDPAMAADDHASCSGLAGSFRAGQPGAEAAGVFETFIEAQHNGVVPGALFSEFSRFHDGSAEVCLDL